MSVRRGAGGKRFADDKVATSSGVTLTFSQAYCFVGTRSAAVTILLPSNPTDLEWHTVKDQSGQAGAYPITLGGNGKNIDGASSASLNQDYDALTVVYESTLGAWSLI